MRSRLLAVISAVLIAQAASVAGQPKAAALAGTWQTAKIAIAGANPRTITVPPAAPYLTIFTAKHYSRTEIQSETPRAALADASKATADELRAAWGPVVAEAGSYEISGDKLTLHPLASKSPAAMAAGAFIECTFKLDGNTLTIAQVRNQAGPYPSPVTFTLTRIE
ncbi:MAG TPA: hypothetical protein VJN96_10795 [Vicinamibacterales bacterium]|nr:hypothetical protein [Vicinamibacterales bacterium]